MHQRGKARHQRSQESALAFLAFQALIVGAFVGLLIFGLGDWVGLWS